MKKKAKINTMLIVIRFQSFLFCPPLLLKNSTNYRTLTMMPSGLGMSSWKETVMTALRSFSFLTGVTKLRSRISPGTNMSLG